MKNRILSSLLLTLILLSSLPSEARVGGGRSFGSRGSRGFSAPPRSGFRSSPYQSAPQSAPQHPYSQPNPYQQPTTPQSSSSSFLRNMGAGFAGGMLGSWMARSLGFGGYGGGGMGGGMSGGGGIGLFELLLIGGLIYMVFRFFQQRKQYSSGNDEASELWQRSRQTSWPNEDQQRLATVTPIGNYDATPIQTDLAMDLFFQIQGAWGNRDLTTVQNLLEREARDFLDQEISRLKAARQINRLENIAVRNTDVVESWKETGKDYSTVHFVANLLDFTVDEQTQQVVEGSKTSPVKFEEFWTFSKDSGASNWKLSAIQQS